MDPNIPELLHEVETLGQAFSQDQLDGPDQNNRKKLRAAVSKLSIALDTPGDIIDNFTYMPMNTVLIRIAVDLNIFVLLTKENMPMSTAQLAEKTGADISLLRRILKGLAAINALEEVDVETYIPTKISRTFAQEKGISNLKCFNDCMEYAWRELPSFLAETGYKNPSDPLNTAIQKGLHTKDSVFDWIFQRPEYLANFNVFMRTQRDARANWLDFYPIDKEFEHLSDKNAVLLLDVGGGLGHEIQQVRSKHANVPGRLILQDLAYNTDQIQASSGIEAVAHDFFTPQPIKGARIYYFRNVLHDWPDDKCGVILGHTTTAMKKGYSKILINEFVVPARGVSAFVTHIDINMMSILGAMERTEQQWRDLLGAHGLEVVKIWPTVEDNECVIEAVLA